MLTKPRLSRGVPSKKKPRSLREQQVPERAQTRPQTESLAPCWGRSFVWGPINPEPAPMADVLADQYSAA
jgi:hypothetical protein